MSTLFTHDFIDGCCVFEIFDGCSAYVASMKASLFDRFNRLRWESFASLAKELVFDITVAFPYAISDAILYLSTAESFIAYLQEEDDEIVSSLLYYYMPVAALNLGVVYYCTFAQTNSRMFNVERDTVYTSLKKNTRKILGIPGSLTKNTISSMSLFLSVNDKLSSKAMSATAALFVWVVALPSALSLLWSKHESEIEGYIAPDRKTVVKYLLIHACSFTYALNNASLYFSSTLELPEKLGLMDEAIGDNGDFEDNVLYYSIALLMLFPLIAVYASYAHLNENAFGLTKNEHPKWRGIKLRTKKITGIPSAAIKISNASASFYGVTQTRGVRDSVSIPLTVVCTVSGLITQSSILFSNPIRTPVLAGQPALEGSANRPEEEVSTGEESANRLEEEVSTGEESANRLEEEVSTGFQAPPG